MLVMGPIAMGQTDRHAEHARVDSVLANELRADEYGMMEYVLAILKPGPNRDQDSATVARLLHGHLKNNQRLAEEGKIGLAGPFTDDSGLAGIFVYNVGAVEEARVLGESDPAIRAGRLTVKYHPRYGSAALQKVTEIHARIQRASF
jgi:uncharacterized protein YciI